MLHRPPIARVTVIVVAERRRRSGVRRALVDAMRALAVRAGATDVEAISGVEIRGPRASVRAVGAAGRAGGGRW